MESRRRYVLSQEVTDAEQGHVPPDQIAWLAARLRENKLPINRLERFCQNHDYWLPFLIVDPERDASSRPS